MMSLVFNEKIGGCKITVNKIGIMKFGNDCTNLLAEPKNLLVMSVMLRVKIP